MQSARPKSGVEARHKKSHRGPLDARNAFGFVAGCMSIDKEIEIASTYGLNDFIGEAESKDPPGHS